MKGIMIIIQNFYGYVYINVVFVILQNFYVYVVIQNFYGYVLLFKTSMGLYH